MKFRSTAVVDAFGSPGITRRLSISTRVRLGPRPRRSTVAAPVAALEIDEPWPANTCGRELVMSSMRVTPWALMSALPIVVTGAIEVRFGDGIRVPVTTISETSPAAASAVAAAWAAIGKMTTAAAPHRIEVVRRWVRTALIKIIPRRARTGRDLAPAWLAFYAARVIHPHRSWDQLIGPPSRL